MVVVLTCVCVWTKRLYELVTEVWNGLERRLTQCCLMQLFFIFFRSKWIFCSVFVWNFGSNEYSVLFLWSLFDSLGHMNILCSLFWAVNLLEMFLFLLCVMYILKEKTCTKSGCNVQRENLQPIVLLRAAYKTSIYCSVKQFCVDCVCQALVNGTKDPLMYVYVQHEEGARGRARKGGYLCGTEKKLTIKYINIYGTSHCITCIFFAFIHVTILEELYDLAL